MRSPTRPVAGSPRRPVPEARFSDLGNARRLVALHGKDLRYCREMGKWYVWDGRRWQPDSSGQVLVWAKNTIEQMHREASRGQSKYHRKLAAHAVSSESDARIKAMAAVAQTEPGIPIITDDLDSDPWLLNCLNGEVDLRTGAMRPHYREDLITRLAPVYYDPDAWSVLWDTFLDTACAGSEALSAFLQRAVGYSLTGDTGEEVIFFVHGPAATGKSTFIEAVKAALGDYAKTADMETFLARKDSGGPRNDIARLAGARFVASTEMEDGRRLAEGLVKMLTGGDKTAARFLYQETFEFTPQFKIWLAANHAPRVRDDDDAIWRRILRIPFERVIPKEEREPGLKLELRNPDKTGAAILAWAVKGCMDWRCNGLGVPPVVEQATEAYRQDMDPLAEFFTDCCEFDPSAWTATVHLRAAYEEWARQSGAFILNDRRFADRLKARGCGTERRSAGRGWLGIRLLDA